jgi:hypothetical protein
MLYRATVAGSVTAACSNCQCFTESNDQNLWMGLGGVT